MKLMCCQPRATCASSAFGTVSPRRRKASGARRERQERDLTASAARADYEVVGVYKETESGAKLIASSGAR